MRGSRVAASSSGDATAKKALATIISSTRNRRRPVPITEVANSLAVASREFGGLGAVAELVGVSAKMLGQFAAVQKLVPSVRRLFSDRKLDSVDAVAHLVMLRPGDQKQVAKALAADLLDTMDVRAVVQLRKLRPNEPIRKIIERVKGTKTTRHFIVEFATRDFLDRAAIEERLERIVHPSEIVRLELRGSFGRLVVSELGKKQLKDAARRARIPLGSVVQRALSETL
jgi:hypothetical protein